MKIRIGENGICRLTDSTLKAKGFSNFAGNQFQLFRNGKEVPIFVTSNSMFGNNDYLEFHAKKQQGEVDRFLYMDSTQIPNAEYSLFNDSATYFLTISSPSSNYLRYNSSNSTLPIGIPSLDYFYKLKLGGGNPSSHVLVYPIFTDPNFRDYTPSGNYHNLKGRFNMAFSSLSGDYGGQNFNFTQNGIISNKTAYILFTYLPLMNIVYGYNFNMYLNINGNVLIDTIYNNLPVSSFVGEAILPYNLQVNSNLLISGANSLHFRLHAPFYSSEQGKRISWAISNLQLFLPTQTSVDNSDYFEFYLPTFSTYQTITLTGLTPNSIYTLKKPVSSTYETFTSDPSGKAQLGFTQNDNLKNVYSIVKSNSGFTQAKIDNAVQFNDISIANQTNYIIVTNPILLNDNLGNQYLNDYKNYRESLLGGQYHVKIVSIADIANQFGYGVDNHPLGLKAYLNYAYSNWNQKDSLQCFIISKGIAPTEALSYYYTAQNFPMVVNYSHPGGDLLFGDFDYNIAPEVAVGRLPVKFAHEIATYLDKVKSYESYINGTANTDIASQMYRKNIMHMVGIGANDTTTRADVTNQLLQTEPLLEGKNLGGNVKMFRKETGQIIDELDANVEDSMLNIKGQNIITFYGHSSPTTFDFNLSSPLTMTNKDKYFHFFALGCTAANQYIMSGGSGLSELYNFQPQGASVTFSGTSSQGWTNVLGKFYKILAQNISIDKYGATIGQITNKSVKDLLALYPNNWPMKIHMEEWNLNGDPAIRFFNIAQPDYAVEANYIHTNPSVINGSQSNIQLNWEVFNIGKLNNDSVYMTVVKQKNDGSTENIMDTNFVFNQTSFAFHKKFTVDPLVELGVNKIVISIDPLDSIKEASEMNNIADIQYRILSADVVPAFPYEYGIVNYDSLKLISYTIDPFAPAINYTIELDTTKLFNSSSKMSRIVNSKGGVVEWSPNINMVDSTVYYWRIRPDTVITNGEMRWKYSSFVYLPQSSPGWNQSHYYQYLDDSYSNLYLDSARKFRFEGSTNKLKLELASLYGPVVWYNWDDAILKGASAEDYTFSCSPIDNLLFTVIDSISGKAWTNQYVGNGSMDGGRFQSLAPCRSANEPIFAFTVRSSTERKQAMDFIDSIPAGHYVLVYNVMSVTDLAGSGIYRNDTYAKDLMADTSLFGSGNSLYHKLKGLGFDQFDSFYKNRPFGLFTQKGVPGFDTKQYFGLDSTDKLFVEFEYRFAEARGSMNSTVIGPSYDWKEAHWKGFDIDNGVPGDSSIVGITGIESNNLGIELTSSIPYDTSITYIDHSQYPYLKLNMENKDQIHRTPNQLKYWRINFQEAPDLSLDPASLYIMKDTVVQGQGQVIKVAVRNISKTNVSDSIKVRLSYRDDNGNVRTIDKNYQPLSAQSQFIANFDIPTSNSSSQNYLSISVNPEQDFIEKTYLNNVLYNKFMVKGDGNNPLIDVTFDNIHIMNNDLVSSVPHIEMEVKDDNSFLPINDTSLLYMKLYKVEPGNNVDMGYNFASPETTFIPADSGSVNKAKVELRPTLEDGTYLLEFSAKDITGNKSRLKYQIQFVVINKSSITNLINYPNPFTTSTRFVFTLTGSKLPDNMQIQIFTITGKLVKEIRQSELGPLHIGNNITEYAWDGTDNYGDPVGNGVYLYRVRATIDGQGIDHRDLDVDKAFTQGFGKMYIAR